jgi:8-oxo-dGTP pyrophosphatase MutT (NUDIX family)
VTDRPDVPDLDELRIRPSARAVIVDPDARVLLVRFEFPRGTLWATPGGGQEPGEDDAATVRRELDEEVGLRDLEVGAHLWTRTIVVPFLDGSWDGQCERVYLVHSPSFVPQPSMSWEQLMAEHVHELRWWTVDELLAAARDGVRFAPRELPTLVAAVVADGPPGTPLVIGA